MYRGRYYKMLSIYALLMGPGVSRAHTIQTFFPFTLCVFELEVEVLTFSKGIMINLKYN